MNKLQNNIIECNNDNDIICQTTEFINKRSLDAETIIEDVKKIIKTIKSKGDQALIEYTKQYDKYSVSNINQLIIKKSELKDAYIKLKPQVKEALELAKERIISYHKKQMPTNLEYQDDINSTLGYKWNPLDSVGVYVPGGLTSYPSSVLMNIIPAKVAQVKRIIMTVPKPQGKLNPIILATAYIAEIDEVITVGGAQAIATLAWGTETITEVDKIIGPGNNYVTQAKKLVFGKVGIDTIAGPSEILCVADKTTNPQWIAADLLSQAEHDKMASSVLITDDKQYAQKILQYMQEYTDKLPKKNIILESWNNYGCIFLVPNLIEYAPKIINKIAPEHLEIAIENPQEIMTHIRHAGAIFLGKYTPEAIGDYIAGPSHVLPTMQASKYSSGLSVLDFMKKSSIISCSAQSFNQLSNHVITLAEEEKLDAHALSIKVRIKKNQT